MKHQNPKSKWFRQFFYFSLSPTFCDKNSYYLLLWVATVEFFVAILHCTCWKGCWPWEMFSVILGNSLMKCERSILDRLQDLQWSWQRPNMAFQASRLGDWFSALPSPLNIWGKNILTKYPYKYWKIDSVQIYGLSSHLSWGLIFSV